MRGGAFQEFSLRVGISIYIVTKRNGMREKKIREENWFQMAKNILPSFYTETPMKRLQPTIEQPKPGRFFALFIGFGNRILPFLNLWHFVLILRMKKLSVVL